MDFVNKTFAQLKDLFGSMAPGARIVAGLLLAVVVLSLVYLVRYSPTSSGEFLLGGRPLSANEMVSVEAAFAKANLTQYSIEGNRIRIPRGQKAAYIGAMAESNALPADFNAYFKEALGSAGAFESKDQYETRLKFALQKELSLIIRSMKGIESATVHYDVEKKGGFPPKKEYTAMVAVLPTGGEPLSTKHIESIRQLVASSIAGLKASNITVSDLAAGLAYPGSANVGADSPNNNAYAKNKKAYEKDWTEKIHAALSFIPGLNVAVYVSLNPEMDGQKYTLKYEPKAVGYDIRDTSTTETSTSDVPAGRAGLAAQGANQPGSISKNSTRSSVEKTASEQKSLVGRNREYVKKASLVPSAVSVSIGVPSSYYVDIWRQRKALESKAGDSSSEEAKPAVPTSSELASIEKEVQAKIEDAIVKLLPRRPATDTYKYVRVFSYQHTPPEPETPPATTATIVTWLSLHWSTLGMGLLGLVSLLMLRRTLGSAAQVTDSQEDKLSAAMASRSSVPDDETEEEMQERVLKRGFNVDGPNFREELAELVQTDPDTAASILSSWIGNAP